MLFAGAPGSGAQVNGSVLEPAGMLTFEGSVPQRSTVHPMLGQIAAGRRRRRHRNVQRLWAHHWLGERSHRGRLQHELGPTQHTGGQVYRADRDGVPLLEAAVQRGCDVPGMPLRTGHHRERHLAHRRHRGITEYRLRCDPVQPADALGSDALPRIPLVPSLVGVTVPLLDRPAQLHDVRRRAMRRVRRSAFQRSITGLRQQCAVRLSRGGVRRLPPFGGAYQPG
mmetsp:Transcript_15202/g.45180  ORF Transcript_15202/g.45180 Transcript_15202/m.45180 type:complete len:225 (-) Transcript_15202:142-816(-)